MDGGRRVRHTHQTYNKNRKDNTIIPLNFCIGILAAKASVSNLSQKSILPFRGANLGSGEGLIREIPCTKKCLSQTFDWLG